MAPIIYSTLPPGPEPDRATARTPVRTLSDHQIAFLNCNNPTGFHAEAAPPPVLPEQLVEGMHLCEIRGVEERGAEAIVQIVKGKHTSKFARLPHKWLAWADRGVWATGKAGFAVLVDDAFVEREHSPDIALTVSRRHSAFLRLLVKQFLDMRVQSHIPAAGHVGAILVPSDAEFGDFVGKDGVNAKQLALLAGLERLTCSRLPPADYSLGASVRFALKQLLPRPLGRNVDIHPARRMDDDMAVMAIVVPDPRQYAQVVGRGGSMLELIAKVSGQACMALPDLAALPAGHKLA